MALATGIQETCVRSFDTVLHQYIAILQHKMVILAFVHISNILYACVMNFYYIMLYICTCICVHTHSDTLLHINTHAHTHKYTRNHTCTHTHKINTDRTRLYSILRSYYICASAAVYCISCHNGMICDTHLI